MTRPLKIGLPVLLSAAGLASVDVRLATVPLALYGLLFITAPFIHWLGFFFPVINRGPGDRRRVALTFDDGPDPVTTPALLELLAHHALPATFFVIGERAARYPELIRTILAQGHTIGNHGFHHDTLAAFKGAARVYDEISDTQRVLVRLGVAPLLFRPPVGITYPAMGRALDRLGLTALTFSCRAWDRGNRSLSQLAEKILRRVKPGAIIMLHDSRPAHAGDVPRWLNGVSSILTGLTRKGLEVRPLAELIGRPVDRRRSS